MCKWNFIQINIQWSHMCISYKAERKRGNILTLGLHVIAFLCSLLEEERYRCRPMPFLTKKLNFGEGNLVNDKWQNCAPMVRSDVKRMTAKDNVVNP